MAFALIQAGSRPLLAASDAVESAAPAEADRAAAALRSDYERWSRWVLGVVAFLAATGGGFVAAGLAATIAALGRVTAVDLIATVVAAVIALGGAALLVALWWTGRALTRGASHWLRAPYASGRRAPRAAGWVQARTINLEPRILVRLITAAFALLVAVGGIALVVRDLVVGPSIMTVPALLVGICGALSGIGQVGGVTRLVNGLGAGDPLWSRLSRTVRNR